MNHQEYKGTIRRKSYLYSFIFIGAILLVSFVYGYIAACLLFILNYIFQIEHLDLILTGIFFTYLTTNAITRYHRLKAVGGKAIAEKLNATKIEGAQLDINEIKVRNIVDELSIASGIKSPPIYILKNEFGMNAFVAGFSQEDAVFIISQGAIEKFNRDELSAVISHEYCHLQNGDMAFNMLMLCWSEGLDLPYRKASKVFTNRVDYAVRHRSQSGFLIFGSAILMFIGLLGHALCGAIIAAINRNREYLADIDAVRLGRENTGLVSALKKISLSPERSYLMNANTELNIFMFADSSASFLYPTHPTIVSRIKAINPKFDTNELEQTNDIPYDKDLDTRYSGKGRIFIYASYHIVKKLGAVLIEKMGDEIIKKTYDTIPPSILSITYKKPECIALITDLLSKNNTHPEIKPEIRLGVILAALTNLSTLPKDEKIALFQSISGITSSDQDIHQVCLTVLVKLKLQVINDNPDKTFLTILPSISKLLMIVCSMSAKKSPEKLYTKIMRYQLIDINLPYHEIENPKEVLAAILPEIIRLDYDGRIKLMLSMGNTNVKDSDSIKEEGRLLIYEIFFILVEANKRDLAKLTSEEESELNNSDPLR